VDNYVVGRGRNARNGFAELCTEGKGELASPITKMLFTASSHIFWLLRRRKL
jgi:hypothetical protein